MVLRIGVARVLRGGVAGSARVVLAEPARGVLDPSVASAGHEQPAQRSECEEHL